MARLFLISPTISGPTYLEKFLIVLPACLYVEMNEVNGVFVYQRLYCLGIDAVCLDADFKPHLLCFLCHVEKGVFLRRCFSPREDDAGDGYARIFDEAYDLVGIAHVLPRLKCPVVTVMASYGTAAEENGADRSSAPIHRAQRHKSPEIDLHDTLVICRAEISKLSVATCRSQPPICILIRDVIRYF